MKKAVGKKPHMSSKKGKGTEFGKRKKSNNPYARKYGQAKGSNQGIGKVTVYDCDSDDSSLELDDEEEYEKLLEQVKEESKRDIKPLIICVSPGLLNVANGCVYHVVTFPKAGKLFLLKEQYYIEQIKILLKKRKMVNPNLYDDGGWIDTIKCYHMRNDEYGEESVYRKTANNNTIDLLSFVHAIPKSEYESFRPKLEYRTKCFGHVCNAKGKSVAAGRNALKFVRNLRTGDHSGLGAWALKRAGGDETKAAKMIADDMYDYYGGGHSFEYDVPLNRYMVDYDIKDFLTKFVGISSWNDLNEDDKRSCFRDYPKKSLPDWKTIERESY